MREIGSVIFKLVLSGVAAFIFLSLKEYAERKEKKRSPLGIFLRGLYGLLGLLCLGLLCLMLWVCAGMLRDGAYTDSLKIFLSALLFGGCIYILFFRKFFKKREGKKKNEMEK